MNIHMDSIDRDILKILQHDHTVPVSQIADQVGASRTACWRRIKSMEAAGVIKGHVTLIDRDKAGLPVTVFVAVKTSSHDLDWLDKFAAAVSGFPEIMEFYRMSGDIDYLLRVVVPDIPAYDSFYKRLIQKIDLADVSSNFAMEEIKFTTALPL